MTQRRQSLATLAALALSAATAHGFQRQADEVRRADPDRFEPIYAPSGDRARVAALGHHTLAADALWVRAVLSMAEALEQPDGSGCRWLGGMLLAVAALDPKWPTVYSYGAPTMRVCGDVATSDALYRAGMEQIPNDERFPVGLAMNAYLYREDREEAESYLDRAAAAARLNPKPGAGRYYAAFAADLRSELGHTQAALDYLAEELKVANTPQERAFLRRKINELTLELLSP